MEASPKLRVKSSTLSGPQKSFAVRQHNLGKSLKQIAELLRNRSSVVEAYLKGREGYPGNIGPRRPELQKPPGSSPNRASRTKRSADVEPDAGDARAAEKQVESRKPVTLPPMPWDGEKANANEVNRR